MKKIKITYITLFLLFVVTALINNGFAQHGREVTDKNEKKNGKYQLYHPNGKLKEKGTYKDGLNIGRKLIYDANGVLLKDENFIIIENQSVLDGRVKYYFTGQISVYRPDNTRDTYHGNGRISADFRFKKGKKDGMCKEYYLYENNNLKSTEIFKDGLKHGAYTHYWPNGNIQRQGIYYEKIQVGNTIYQNVYDGKIITYQENGKKDRIEHWKNYMKNGIIESYNNNTGELNRRENYIDNLKVTEELFARNGNKTSQTFFEVKEINGKKVSQKIAITEWWEDGTVRYEWKDDGTSKRYYDNGQLESIAYLKNDSLHSVHQTFFKNGQIRQNYLYNTKKSSAYNYNRNIDWNFDYDEEGRIVRIFYAKGGAYGDNIVDQRFENGFMKEFLVDDIFKISFFPGQRLATVYWQNIGQPAFGYAFFSNQQLRRVYFRTNEWATTVNLTTDGNVINTDFIEKNNLDIAKQIALQYNPDWTKEKLVTETDFNGTHRWKYADGSPFFNIEFKDSLPHGRWIVFDAASKDTLFHAEFEKGRPVGKWIRKRIDGIIDFRKEYFSNHQLKENYRYQNGTLIEIIKKDSTGKDLFNAEYFPNGKLKNMGYPQRKSHLSLSENGDTLYHNLLLTDIDSIWIWRQFYPGNKIKVEKREDVTGTGERKNYLENGQLLYWQELKNSKQHGAYKKYDEEGKLVMLGHYKEGKRDGEWVNYLLDGTVKIFHYKDGDLIVTPNEDDKNSCKCYDLSLSDSKIGFAQSLDYFQDYKSIKRYIPKTIIPINNFNYDRIFFRNLRTDSGRENVSASMRLLFDDEFSFYYSVAGYLKISLNPCKTEGYISNINARFSYTFYGKEVYARLETKRISLSLENNPLKNMKNKQSFTAYFDTEGIYVNPQGILEIQYSNERNDCFTLGVINDFLEVEVIKAKPIIDQYMTYSSDLPLQNDETGKFYGFEITEAKLKFNYVENKDEFVILAETNTMLAGANYVVAMITIVGNALNDNEFILEDENKTIHIDKLQRFLEQKGFSRVKTKVGNDTLQMQFYTEK